MRNFDVDYTPYYYPQKAKTKKSTPRPRRQKPQKGRSRGQTLGVLFIIICLFTTLLVLDDLVGGVFPDTPVMSGDATTYYCVQTGIYNDRDTANFHANSDKERGSGGYVIYDGYYRVIASVYTKESDAKTIADRLNEANVSASVYAFTISSITEPSLSPEEQSAIATASGFTHRCYVELYELSNLVDQDNLTAGELSTRLYAIKKYAEECENTIPDVYSEKIIKLSACIGASREILDELGSAPSSSALRYAYTAILAQRL